MKSLLASLGLLATVLSAHASTVTYTFNGTSFYQGTSFTYVDPNGFLAFDTGSLTPTTASDLFYLGTDFGPLLSFDFSSSTSYSLTSTSARTSGGSTPYQISALTPLETLSSGTLSITSTSPTVTPDPSSLLLLGTGALTLAATARRRFLPN